MFLERGEGREKRRERSMNAWPLTCPLPGAWSTTQAGALTGNQTCDTLVHRLALNPLSDTSQGIKKQGSLFISQLHLIILSLSKQKIQMDIRDCSRCGLFTEANEYSGICDTDIHLVNVLFIYHYKWKTPGLLSDKNFSLC